MYTVITELDKSGYRKFGITTSILVVVLFGLVIPFIFSIGYPKWPWILAAVLTSWSLVAPSTLKPVYLGWMKFGMLMNWINTRLILGILFYVFFLPLGLIFKIIGKDPMRRKIDKNLSSYREESNPLESKHKLEHPY